MEVMGKGKGKGRVPVHIVQAYRGVEVLLHAF